MESKCCKAYGGCEKCYGKGYSTQLEHYSGRGEFDMGQAGVEIHEQAPYYLPCSCDRGKQIKELLEHTVLKGERRRIISQIKEEVISNFRIGFLRQWLNEDRITEPSKMVTNEDIISWLGDTRKR